MSFAAPIWLAVAGLVAAGVVVAHLISTSVPQRDPFPTARFVPEGTPLTVLRTRRLTDLALLLLRLLAVVLLGFAFAGARISRSGPTRVVLADHSRAVASPAEVRDSVTALGSDVVVVAFDTSTRLLPRSSAADSGQPGAARRSRGSLSAALVAAHRAMADATKDRDRTELVIVSPLVNEEIDSATAPLLRLWEGPVRLIRIASAPVERTQLTIRASGDDPVSASLSRGPIAESRGLTTEGRVPGAAIRIVRDQPNSADSLWARDSGGALVVWPAQLATSALKQRVTIDTAHGVAAGAHVVIGAFARTHDPHAGVTIARWLDGVAAAAETPLGLGCVREVAIPVDGVGDVALRDSFRALAHRMAQPCGGAGDFASVELAQLRGEPRGSGERTGMADPSSLPPDPPSRWPLILALLALMLLVGEQFLRRRVPVA